MRDLNDPDLMYVPVTTEQLAQAQRRIHSCIACNPDAEVPFDSVVRDFTVTMGYADFILPAPAICPKCKTEVHEKTLVQLVDPAGLANFI